MHEGAGACPGNLRVPNIACFRQHACHLRVLFALVIRAHLLTQPSGCQPGFGLCGSTSSSAPASSTSAAIPISTDGSCSTNGRTCLGSAFGNCCSASNYCGTSAAYCSTGTFCSPSFPSGQCLLCLAASQSLDKAMVRVILPSK